jgi:hypothetical protein
MPSRRPLAQHDQAIAVVDNRVQRLGRGVGLGGDDQQRLVTTSRIAGPIDGHLDAAGPQQLDDPGIADGRARQGVGPAVVALLEVVPEGAHHQAADEGQHADHHQPDDQHRRKRIGTPLARAAAGNQGHDQVPEKTSCS